MSAFQKSPRPRPQHHQPQPSIWEKGKELKKLDLFPLAVFIMGVVSCYTTATGIYPMLNNWFLSYATAVALSVFMVAIALRIPQAYREGNQVKLIMGYIFVASFSVLLNFNAIYGMFSSEKLLYEELKQNKSMLTAIQVRAHESLDEYYGANETERKLQQAKGLLAEETSNQVDPGYGRNARRINQESVIPLEAELAAIRSKYDPTILQIDSLALSAQSSIDMALSSSDMNQYRVAVDRSVDAYTQIGEMTQNQLGEENFSFEGLVFQHRDVGNLNHSLWTLGNLSKLEGKQASAVIVSLVLALLIDFIVLFVLVLVNKPERETQEESSEEKNPENSGKFRKTTLSKTNATASDSGIYAHRLERKNDAPTDSRTLPYAVRVNKAEPTQEVTESSSTTPPMEPVFEPSETFETQHMVVDATQEDDLTDSAWSNPSDADEHVTDILPQFQYKEGQEELPPVWRTPKQEDEENDPLAFDLFAIHPQDQNDTQHELNQ